MMEKYRRQVKQRAILFAVFLLPVFLTPVVMIAGVAAGAAWALGIPDYSLGFVTGLCASGVVMLTMVLVSHFRMLKNAEVLKAAYIKATDERNQLIRQKSGEAAFAVFTVTLAAAMLVSSFIDWTVFVVLFVVFTVMTFTRIAAKLYYTRKMG